MIWTTLDSLPLLPEAVSAAPKIKNYYVWANFAVKEMQRLGHKHVGLLRGTLDPTHFSRFPDEKRKQMRAKYNIAQDEFIIGFVFRNQLRKSVPNLLEGYKLFIEKNPKYRILIKSHKKIPVQKVIRLIEEVRLAGTDNIKLVNLQE